MIRIDGMDDLTRLFKQLPDRINTKVIRSISRKGARVVVKEARAKTPVGETGNLKRSIQVILPRKRSSPGVLVGASVKGGNRGSGYHSHFLAEGTAKRRTKKGANRGKMKAQGNWIGKAAESVQTSVFAEMTNSAVPLIDREINRLANKRV
jgi:HK97 gp10 family phage protein